MEVTLQTLPGCGKGSDNADSPPQIEPLLLVIDEDAETE
jgi:hypothetical protein